MASHTTHTILLGFLVVFWCLQLFQAGDDIPQKPPHGGVARLAAAAFLPAIVTTFGLTLLLLFAHVRALGRANAAGGGAAHHRFVGRLAKATLASTAVAHVAGAVLRVRLGGADGVVWFWLNTK